MKGTVKILFWLILTAFTKQLCAQNYSFENFTVENGLSQSQILSVFQDDDGVMWFGTNNGGITKYDGNSFEYITDKQGLPDNVIFSIAKDKDNRILIGTNGGLSVYDHKAFKNYTVKNGLTHDRIFKIFVDSQKKVWLCTGQGVTLMEGNVFKKFDSGGMLDDLSIFNVMEDSEHNLWFSTLGKGVFKYDGKKLTAINSTNTKLESDFVYSVCEVSKGNYLFFTSISLDRYSDNKVTPVHFGFFDFLLKRKTEIGYYDYGKDNNGNIWLGTDFGLIKYNQKGATLINDSNGLVNRVIWRIFQDREGNMWFASKESGISKLQNEAFINYNASRQGIAGDVVSAIYQGRDGKIYLGTKEGLSIMDKGKIKSYTATDFGALNAEILAIEEDDKGTLYLGTSFGVLVYDGRSFKRIQQKEGNINYCNDIVIDSKGQVWLGTLAGLAKIENNQLVAVQGDYLPKKSIFDIHIDKKGVFWFAAEDGLYKYDGNSVQFFSENEGFIRKQVFSIFEDQHENIWVGTPSSGIFKYSNGNFTCYNEKSGLSSNNIQSIVVDKNDNIWVGETSCIEKLSFLKDGTLKIRHYGVEEGFVGQECVLNAIMIDKDERLLAGTSKGLMIFREQYDRENKLEPITRLKSIKLFSQPTDWSLYSKTVGDNNIPTELELEYNKNYLTFNFIGVSLTTPSKVRYQYMLKGLDKDWLPVTEKTEAIYSNIPFGKYEFLLKASNGAGVWNKEPVSFTFTILPPFWRTWWFYSIVALIIISFIYSYLKIQSSNRQILQQKEIIEDKNKDLEVAKLEVEEKNKNITDSINYAKRIQEAILPPPALLKSYLKDSFVFYRPKDIVSGDFYYFARMEDKLLVTAVDCTGHGVPGALMSIVGHTALKNAANKFISLTSGEVLDKLNRNVENILRQNNATALKDGMDISLIIVDPETSTIQYSGANNPVYVVRNKQAGPLIVNGQSLEPNISTDRANLFEIKADKQPIGAFENRKAYTTHTFKTQPDDCVYIFTDGYADQFGGDKNKKFMYKNFKELLLQVKDQDMSRQEAMLQNTIYQWKGLNEQVDDILVIGVKI